MQYSVARGVKGKIDVKVDVPRVGFEEAYEAILTKLGQETNIAGFRPGNTPRDVVLGHVGSNKVLNQAASFLISKHLSDIIKKEDLVPIDSPKIAIETLAEGSPFSFTASFTQKPEVKIGDWKNIKVTKVKAKEITEKDIDQSIKNIFEAWLKERSKIKRDRFPLEKQNSKVEEGEEKKTGKFIFERSEKTKGSAVREANEKAFIYDAHGNKIFLSDKGTEGTKVTKDTEGKIDDEFAKAIGARDLGHLREIVRRDLETIVAGQVEAKLEQEVFEEILKIAQVEVPDILIEDELNRILVRLTSELERQGSDLEKYLSEQKTTIDELKAKWRAQAEKNVRITLVMDEIGRQEGVKVAKEEVERALTGVTEQNLSPDQKEDLERYLALSIFQAKTLDKVKKTIAA